MMMVGRLVGWFVGGLHFNASSSSSGGSGSTRGLPSQHVHLHFKASYHSLLRLFSSLQLIYESLLSLSLPDGGFYCLGRFEWLVPRCRQYAL